VLLDALIKNGIERCIEEARDKIYSIKTLCDFSFIEEGNDKGAGSKKFISFVTCSGRFHV
jgi:hypothetical protein